MASKGPKKDTSKGNKATKSGTLNKPSTPVVAPPDAPTEKLSIDIQPIDSKKWCLRDTLIFRPVIEKWYVDKDNVKISIPVDEQSSYPLRMNTIIDILPQDKSISWSGIAFSKTTYDVVDLETRKKDWVITKVVGWISDEDLDDYTEEFHDFEIDIPHATKSSTDLEQDMTIEDEEYDEINARYNMCGELCVTYIVKKEFNPELNIEDVLKNWKESGTKNKQGINVNYAKLVGKGRDEPLAPKNIKEDLLDLYYTSDIKQKVQPYNPATLTGSTGASKGKETKIPLTNLGNDPHDDRHASKEFQEKLLKYYFITLVTINPNTGELIPNPDPKKRNHWVVVDKITHDGVRVEIYNPSPNKRQAYSFREFYNSVGGNPNAGWWVERKQYRTKDESDTAPKPEVSIDNPTPDPNDAEQYILVDRLKKVNLCGEFSVSYILKNSLDRGLENWSTYQEGLKNQGKTTAGIWELATVLQAFGINTEKAGAPNGKHYSIDRILKFWKATQPDLYGSILGGSNNETTGFDDLLTILKAHGYNNKDDYKFGNLPSSPGASAEMLKRYYFIAGVRIDTGKRGRLKNKLGDGVDHWVVVTEINPKGTLVGGNGGWVYLYNPFMNVLEEYSYKEFMESFSGVGLWVTKELAPTFTSQARVPAKDNSKKPKGKTKVVVVNKISEASLRREIQKAMDNGTTSLGSIADMLSNPKKGFGWSKQEILKLLKNPEVKSTRKSLAEVERLLCASLGIGSIPREIAKWIRDASDGDSSFATSLASILRDFGILVIVDKNGNEIKPGHPPLPVGSMSGRIMKNLKDESLLNVFHEALASLFDDSTPTSRLAHNVTRTFTDQAIEQLRKIPPIQVAYKSWPDYIKWETTIALPKSNMYRVRHWGDRVMGPLGFDTNTVGTGNFQAAGLYNSETGFGAVSNYIHILREDIDQLIDMQFDEIVDGKKVMMEDKMNWLCQFVGRIYFFDNRKDSWQNSMRIRWGTLALGGNLVQVVGVDEFTVKLPGEPEGKKPVKRKLAKLAGFKHSDWSRPLDELLAEGLVHRCFVANQGNVFADTSRGTVYSPLFDVSEWSFNNGTEKPKALYIPFEYLELRPDPKLGEKPQPEKDHVFDPEKDL